MKIEIKRGNILEEKADALVNPANSSGYMGYGVSKAIVLAGGREIEKEAVEKAPILVGEPVITTAGKLPFKAIIHTATVDDTTEKIERGIISKALIGALFVVDELGYNSIVVPGMGTGIGGVEPEVSAVAMFEAVKAFTPIHISKITFVDLRDEMVEAWKKAEKKK